MDYDYLHNDSEIADTMEDTVSSDKPRILLMGLQRLGSTIRYCYYSTVNSQSH
ncbi:hypothetical protein BDF14DRAFT_1760206 [Spinellus fusiger]|nr:hypothetical protein BDF14DRAFT_1760206 [Spinellus fusiger]